MKLSSFEMQISTKTLMHNIKHIYMFSMSLYKNTHVQMTKNTDIIPVKSHSFAVSLTVLAMESWSHTDYVISHAFQL